MYEALMEIMEPKIRLRKDMLRREIQEEAQKDSILRTINTLRDFGHKNPEIKSAIIKTYKLSENEAEEYL